MPWGNWQDEGVAMPWNNKSEDIEHLQARVDRLRDKMNQENASINLWCQVAVALAILAIILGLVSMALRWCN